MKSLIITCLVCFSVSLFAQSTATTGFVEHWTKIYQLDDNQQKKAQAIEVRRQNQLAEIASLKAADPKLYRQKREAIHKGAKAGLKFILRSDQRELFKQQVARETRQQNERTERHSHAGSNARCAHRCQCYILTAAICFLLSILKIKIYRIVINYWYQN